MGSRESKRRRLEPRACQCGGRPERVACVGPDGKTRRGEMLRCAACGNRTEPGRSRELVAREWNAAGWCGQRVDEPEYVPFGPEWAAFVAKMKKPYIVGQLRAACKEALALSATVTRQRARIEELEARCARMRAFRNQAELKAAVDRLVERGLIQPAEAVMAKRRLGRTERKAVAE
jgi:hypothetical protein